MKRIEFEVFGVPVGKQRPRLTYRYGHAMAYTPQKTKDYETLVMKSYLEKEKYHDLYDGAVEMEVVVINEPPASTSKARKERLTKGEYKLTKPDLDNVLKSILDGLNGVAFKDDSQVVSIKAEKRYGIKNVVIVSLKYLDLD